MAATQVLGTCAFGRASSSLASCTLLQGWQCRQLPHVFGTCCESTTVVRLHSLQLQSRKIGNPTWLWTRLAKAFCWFDSNLCNCMVVLVQRVE
jgi:hypothetical protein